MDESCRNGEVFYNLHLFGSSPVTWSKDAVEEERKNLSEEDASKIKLTGSGRPVVTCPSQYRANLSLLNRLGVSDPEKARFVMAQIGIWDGGKLVNGFKCH